MATPARVCTRGVAKLGSLSSPGRAEQLVQPSIVETYHPEHVKKSRVLRYATLPEIIAISCTLGLFGALVALLNGCSPWEGMIIAAMIAGPICLIAAAARMRQVAGAAACTVSLQKGVVTVKTPDHSESAPLDKCSWFPGRTTDDTRLAEQPLRHKAIIIRFPSGRQIACGLSAAHYREWQAALENNQHCPRIVRPGGAVDLLLVLLAFVGSVIGWQASYRLGSFLQEALQRAGWQAQGHDWIAVACGLSGAFLLFWITYRLPVWRRIVARHSES